MKTRIIIFTILAAVLVFGCSRQTSYDDSLQRSRYAGASLAQYDSAVYELEEQVVALSGVTGFNGRTTSGFITNSYETDVIDSNAANLNPFERKLVKNANIGIRVENLETADKTISELLEKYNAYSSSTNIEERYRYYTLRVPSQYYDIFLSEMNGIGRFVNRYENTDDVTIQYYDLEGRLESKRLLLRTFQSYLGRANNIEEILSVEARIAELQRDIEFTGTQLRNLSNTIEYATINLNLLGPAAATSTQEITFGERIKQLFAGFGGFLSAVAVILLGLVIYGIPSLALLILLFWLLFGKIGLARKLWGIVKK